MSLAERFRWAIAPDEGRASALLWGGLVAMAVPGALLALADLPAALMLLLYPVIACGWLVAACGATGYLRWYFEQAKSDMKR